MINKKLISSFDYILVSLMICLAIFGITIIGSATKINVTNDISGEFISQIFWFSSGFILLFAAAFINYHTICKFYIPIYILNIILLVLVLLFGSGPPGVTRWIFGIQPSEFSKVFMILFISKFIDKHQEKINNIGILFLLIFLTLIPVILIQMQPSLSACLVTLAILSILIFMGNVSYKYILILLAIIIPLLAIFIIDVKSENHTILNALLKDYQVNRIVDFVDFDLTGTDQATYQTRNSIWALGSGKLTGKGLYNGAVNQLSYLPESHNDFIFSVIGEEFGFIGCVGVLGIMILMIIRCLIVAFKSMDLLGTLIASGVAGMLAFQTFVNVSVATGLLPNTGMPFPFLSYGGSSMWINMISIGLVINVGMRKPKSMFEG